MARTSPIHYIAPSAISITPNANGSHRDLAVYIAKGAKIKVYSPQAGIGLLDNTYQEWAISGRNRRLEDLTGTKEYTIYARLSKTDKTSGYLVFAAKDDNGDDKYPYIELKNRVHDDPFYVRLGDVLAVENGQRTVTLDTGILGTDDYNNNWALNPDLLPLRIELGCTIDDEDAGPTPYVYWGQSLVLTATLTEGWTGTDIQRFDHWEITRDSGDSDADDEWNHPTGAGSYHGLTDGQITLSHARGYGDDFNGAVSATFTVMAMEKNPDYSSEEPADDVPEYLILKTAVINIHAETVEKYELSMSSFFVSYSPQTKSYSPSGGVVIRFRATDQRGTVFLLTKEMYDRFALSMAYSVEDSGTWLPLQVGTSQSLATATLPVSAFSANKNVNVRLSNAAGRELSTATVAFIRDGEDSKVREWIFLRSATAITFGTEDYPYPSAISGGEVNPGGAATGDDTDKDQDGWVPEGWYDEMQGTDENMPYEYGAYRDYLRGSDSSSSGDPGGQWGEFTNPSIWSHYGTDGNSAPSYSFVIGIESIRVDKDGDYVDTNGRKKANIEFSINVFKTVDDVRDTGFIASVYEVVYYSDGTSASTSYNIRTGNTHNFSKPFRPDATKHVTSIRLRFRQYNGGNVNLYIKEILTQQDGADAAPTAPNILLDTAEYKKPSLWFQLHGENSDGYMGRVARHVNPQGTSDPAGDTYQRIAEQQISGKGMTLLEPETWYTLSGFFNGSGLALIGLLQCGGYVEELYYADGEERTVTLTPTLDIYNAFSLTSEWARHTLTFKTKATMSDTYSMYASTSLLDLTGNASVCMLKLEIGNKATAYLPNEQDMAGEDAVNVLCTPSALIVNQSLSDPSNLNNLSADPSARAIIQILKGIEPQTITAVTITSRGHCTATAGVSGGNGYIQLASVATYTEQGKSYYYDRGYVICSLTYAGGTIDNVKLSFYANLLGTWKETVEADTKAAIAQSNLFDLDPETGQIVESQYLGNFIQSSTQNIATLTAKVNNGKNMLKGVLTGAGWEDEDGNSVEVSDNEFLICSGDNITPPAFTLESGKQYTLSCDNNASVLFNNNEVTFSLSGSRHYAVLTAETTNTLEFRSDVKHPQLELGNVPTEFEADVTEISSRYKQTADNVRIGVTQGLSDTGIDISTGKVDVQANDFRVLDEDNTPLMSVSTSGGIRMIETEIEGSLQVNRTYADGVISTTTSIDAYSWGTGFYVHSSNTNTGYESMATFGSSNVAGRACSLNFSDSDGTSLYIDPTEVKLSEGNVIDVRIHSGGIDVGNGAVSLTGNGIDFDGASMIMRKDGFEYPYADEWGGTGRNSLRGKRYTQIGTNMYLLIYGGLLIGYSTTKPDSSWKEINEIDPDQI